MAWQVTYFPKLRAGAACFSPLPSSPPRSPGRQSCPPSAVRLSSVPPSSSSNSFPTSSSGSASAPADLAYPSNCLARRLAFSLAPVKTTVRVRRPPSVQDSSLVSHILGFLAI